MSLSPSDEEFLEAVGRTFGGQTQHIAAALLRRRRVRRARGDSSRGQEIVANGDRVEGEGPAQ